MCVYVSMLWMRWRLGAYVCARMYIYVHIDTQTYLAYNFKFTYVQHLSYSYSLFALSVSL